MFPADIEAIAERLLDAALKRGLWVSTAESCTGGLLGGALTAVAGTSAIYDRGFITYSNAAKSTLLGVPADLIEAHGAVSEETARAMAIGARDRAGADLAVSVTGIAGPGGGSETKPVGLVHFGLALTDGSVEHVEKRFGDISRTDVRLAAVRTGLEMLISGVERQPV